MAVFLLDAAPYVLFFSLIGLLEANVCPSKENMLPCECRFIYGDNQISCNDILSPEELIPPMRAIAMSGTEVLALTISGSSLMYLPDNLFKNTHIEKVRFVNTEIMSLSEGETAFNGLEDILEELRSTDAKFVSNWNFDQLRNLKKLRLIDVHQMILGAVDHPFPHLPELRTLGIIKAEISFIADDAFSNLPKLDIFNMKDNEITEVKRSMFPNPANSLALIDLSQNMLTSLPEDFFESMPSLRDVLLDNNKFTTLSEKPFSVALSYIQQLGMKAGTHTEPPHLRQHVDVVSALRLLVQQNSNPFRCDCRMRWLVNIRFPHYFQGECSSPEALSGRSIKLLDFKSLWC